MKRGFDFVDRGRKKRCSRSEWEVGRAAGVTCLQIETRGDGGGEVSS